MVIIESEISHEGQYPVGGTAVPPARLLCAALMETGRCFMKVPAVVPVAVFLKTRAKFIQWKK
jgi:hypothetical protein